MAIACACAGVLLAACAGVRSRAAPEDWPPPAPRAPGATLFVSPAGSDAHAGTAAHPLRTLAKAALAVKPGTTVFVAPGSYAGGFRTAISGAEGARIAFVSTVRWAARIVPPAASSNDTAWDNRANYLDIVGFEIDGAEWRGGTRWTHGIYSAGSRDSIRGNHVLNIARESPCTSAGGSAIGVDSYYQGRDSDVIGNLVHDIGPPNCRFVQGIYMSTTGRVVNNVVLRVSEGAIHLWHDARHVLVANNTVMQSNSGIIVGGGDFYRHAGPNDHTIVESNIVVGNQMGISEQGQTGLHNLYRRNLVHGNARYDWQLQNGLTHQATVHAAPLFIGEPGAHIPDLRPAPGSPALSGHQPIGACLILP